MKLVSVLTAILIAGLSSFSVNAQISVVPVNGGTGNLVSIPIPGGSGLNITVGTGSAAIPLENIANTAGARQLHLGDDSSANVPLGFTFPYWGQNFTNSWMYSNGIVSFKDGNIPGAGCCSGMNLTTLRDTSYNYAIMPLWTDLIDINNNATWYKGTANSMTYGWYNTHEYYNNNLSSFEVNINSSGAMSVRYGSAFVSTGHTVTAGMTGDLSQGQYFQYYYGQGFNIPSSVGGLSWGALQGTPGSAINMCYTNPLSDPSCPGYYDAYKTQQCTISALYDPSCPGYQQAYFTQQCSLDPLYNSNCPGYTTAYHDQQCSINPLYATDCTGYQQAYHDQQCSVNTLYATDCPGYATAYLNQQCSINPLYSTTCSGYQQAYHDQQCSINPLYAADCPGYQVAYKAQQCTANPLYATDCPGYAQAYFNQQCSLNGLYSTQCPNYGTAYATQQALLQSQQSTTSATTTSTTSTTTNTVSTTAPSTSSDGTTKVALVADTNVNQVITSTATSASPAAAATSTVPLVQAPASSSSSTATAVAAVVETKQEEKKTEEKKSNESNSNSSSTSTTASTGNSSTDSKPSDQPKTARQELQERRESAAKAKAVEAGKNLGDTMGKAASMEQQAAVQNVVIAAMGYTPGFEAYKVRMPDVVGYKPYSIYKNQANVDNRRLSNRLFGGTDKLHSDMVESQYNKGN